MFSAEDALARMVAERSTTNPDFALLVAAYQQNSDLLDALTDARRRLGLTAYPENRQKGLCSH